MAESTEQNNPNVEASIDQDNANVESPTGQVNQNTKQATGLTHTNIEIDHEATENDSTYGKELSTYTASLTSSIPQWHILLPSDEDEKDRLDMVHEMIMVMLDHKLFRAPIKSPQHAIDLGTGTGIWAIQFADQFPAAEVFGIDLSPIQPTLVPPNCKFLIDDMEDDWVDYQLYNYIHGRYLAASIKDYPRLLKQCYKHAAPGGWVVMQDWDPTLYSEDGSTKGTSIEQYYDYAIPAFKNAGIMVDPGPHLEQWFREAGFKKLGTWNLLQAESGFEATAMAVLTRYENWKPEEVTVLAAKALNDARNRNIHAIESTYTGAMD
ncbi:S-adenosyl-L-methionine-dependent methyltransferase [Thermoascus aurantiacus ATCC 26904]